eukprot:2691744-Rhodomonas_salina.1
MDQIVLINRSDCAYHIIITSCCCCFDFRATSNSGLNRVNGVTRWMTTLMTRGYMVIQSGSMLTFVDLDMELLLSVRLRLDDSHSESWQLLSH